MTTSNEQIKIYNQNRLPQFVQYKYMAMAENTFRFFRGTCHLFYTNWLKETPIIDSTRIWVGGDIHLENFGSYKAADRKVHFNINDFDEAALAPLSGDVIRFMSSMYLVADTLGITYAEATAINKQFIKSYSNTITIGKALSIEKNTADGVIKELLKNLGNKKREDFIRARTNKQGTLLKLRIDNEKTFSVAEKEWNELSECITIWSTTSDYKHEYALQDVAHRIAGTSSIGLNRFIILVKEKTTANYYLLDLKEAIASSVPNAVNIRQPKMPSEAERIVTVQKQVQQDPPALLSTLIYKQTSYVIKELQPTADKINPKAFKNSKQLADCVVTMGAILASGHLQSTGWKEAVTADKLVDLVNREQWINAALAYAEHYAAQVRADYKVYLAAFNKGYFRN